MKRTGWQPLLLAAAVALVAMVYVRTRTAPTTAPDAGGPAQTSLRTPDQDASEGDIVSVTESSLPAPVRDVAEIQRRLANGERGTYIREILLQRDDHNARWPDRLSHPLRVWIQPTSLLPNFQASFPARARSAFMRWMDVDVPVAFTFVDDSALSDIPVVWIDRFDMPISGRTTWTHDQHWWISGASVAVALHHRSGMPLDADAISAIVLHEVGHVLGLDHTQDEQSIMAARVRVRDLSAADERTAQLVYSLPPGSVSKP